MMKIATELYTESLARLPKTGKHIIGHQVEDAIVVYQAYQHAIADYAVKHQQVGGDHFSYDRMSWIKPGFLWMMFRSGWATKENQERVLALWLGMDDFKKILAEAVPTTYKRDRYATEADWKADLKAKHVRVQWDPDHSHSGHKLERRAIQLGLNGAVLAAFGKQYIRKIEDITAFVHEHKLLLDKKGIEALTIPRETIITIEEDIIRKAIGWKTEPE